MKLISLVKYLFKIPRSLAGEGNRKTLKIISSNCKNKIKIKSFISGDKFENWTVPLEWKVKNAYVLDYKGKKIIDYARNNLEIVQGSSSFKGFLNKDELKKKIFTLKKNPNSIPYITNYYSKNTWGVCMAYNNFLRLKNEMYYVNIETIKKNGKMNYGEFFVKGQSKKEIIFSTYICHPQMANNELSGPVVLSALVNKILDYKRKNKLKFSYRVLFLPETIGSISFINSNFSNLKKNVLSVFIVTCVGTIEKFKLIHSRYKNSTSDKIAEIVLNENNCKWEPRSYLHRGSDERQWCSPNVNIACCSIVTSKYGEYDEYHTSKDDLKFISNKGLIKSLNLYFKIFIEFENSVFYINKTIGEPKMDVHGLYPKFSTKKTKEFVKDYMNVIAYCDGTNNLKMLSKYCNIKLLDLKKITETLLKKKIIKKI